MVAEALRNASNLRGLETGGGKRSAIRKDRPGGSIGYNLPLSHDDGAWDVFGHDMKIVGDNYDGAPLDLVPLPEQGHDAAYAVKGQPSCRPSTARIGEPMASTDATASFCRSPLPKKNGSASFLSARATNWSA